MSIPYTVIGILILFFFAGVIYRFCLVRKESGKQYEVGTCKTIGSREIQTDYFTVEENENGLLAVLADGMGKDAGGRIAAKTVIRVFQEVFAEYNMLDHPSYFFQKTFLLAVLADGMGKDAGGRIAAKTVIRVFQEVFAEYNMLDHPSYFFQKTFQTANREILKLLDEGRGRAAVSAVMIQDGFLYYAIVGDVKVAVFRNQELVPIGVGHTVDVLAENKYYQGVLTREEAILMLHEKRVYHYLGKDGFKEMELYEKPIRLKKDDMVAIFSNGMYESIAWKQMEECLLQKKSCKKIAFDLVETVNRKNGDKDNASMILIRIGELV